MNPNELKDAGSDVARLRECCQSLQKQMATVLVGQKEVIRLLLTGLLSGDHMLVVGVPGLAKTMMIKGLANLLGRDFRRIQFTPDLMPADITGTEILQSNESGRRRPAGNSGRETEVRETGRGLVEHLDEIGCQQGHAQLIQYLMNLGTRYKDDGSGPGGDHGFRVKIRDPFRPDTMADWLKLAREQFPDLGETIYIFADRHRDRVLRRHERRANINGLSNFIAVMVATSKVLFVYLRRGVLTPPQVVARMRDYLNTFTGTIPQYRDEETTATWPGCVQIAMETRSH